MVFLVVIISTTKPFNSVPAVLADTLKLDEQILISSTVSVDVVYTPVVIDIVLFASKSDWNAGKFARTIFTSSSVDEVFNFVNTSPVVLVPSLMI